jgi:hypothetical protein
MSAIGLKTMPISTGNAGYLTNAISPATRDRRQHDHLDWQVSALANDRRAGSLRREISLAVVGSGDRMSHSSQQ